MPPADRFTSYSTNLSSPATRIEVITPNDDVDLECTTRALNVSVSGTVAVVTIDGTVADIYIAAGVAFPVRVTRVLATGTSATGIRGLC